MTQALLRPRGRPLTAARVDTARLTFDDGSGPRPVAETHWDLPTDGPVYGCLLNFQCEFEKLGDRVHQPPYNQPPSAPVIYVKTANTHIGYGVPVALPEGVDQVHVGAALGVVIDAPLCRATPEQAAAAIRGYTLVNDVTVPHESLFRQPLKQKNRDGFCPIGPWLVPASEIDDPANLRVRVLINGEARFETGLDQLVRPVPRLLAEISEFTSLFPGDLVLAGVPADTPLAGVGDIMAVEIDGLGRLENPIVREPARGEVIV